MGSPPIRETPFSMPCHSAEQEISAGSWSAVSSVYAGNTPSRSLVHFVALFLFRETTLTQCSSLGDAFIAFWDSGSFN